MSCGTPNREMHERVSGIYAIVNTHRHLVYVGKSCDIDQRWREHRSKLQRGLHKNAPLQRDWKRDGVKAFTWRIVERTQLDMLSDREWLHIQWLRPKYNMMLTGAPRPEHVRHAEIAQLISAGLKGKPKSAEHRRNLGLAKAGKKCPAQSAVLLGRKLSDATRQAMSAAHKRRRAENPTSEETRAKLSAALRGRVFTPEWCEKISVSKRGKKQSPEMIASRMEGMRLARIRRANPPVLSAIAVNE